MLNRRRSLFYRNPPKTRLKTLKQNYKVQVFATDIDSHAIATVRAGLYLASIAADRARTAGTVFCSRIRWQRLPIAKPRHRFSNVRGAQNQTGHCEKHPILEAVRAYELLNSGNETGNEVLLTSELL